MRRSVCAELPDDNGRTPAFAFVVALAVPLVELVTGGRYGMFRDEFYYLVCADHLDWGYVDHPPFSILMLAGVRAVAGDSLLAVRVVPALLGGLLVPLGARLARDLGGGRFGQSLAALSVAIVPQYLAIAGFYSMNAFDLVFWGLAALLVVRLVLSDEPRLWLPLGVVIGLGLMNKISMLFFALGLAVAVLATPLRRHLVRRAFWGGALLAALLFLPYVLWQPGHSWAALEFMRNATRYKIVALSPFRFLEEQILEIHPLNVPLWVGGLVWLLARREGRRFRALGIIYLVCLVVIVMARGKAYYLGPAYPMLLAAGAVRAQHLLEARGRAWGRPALLSLLVIGGMVTAPLAIPVLPVKMLIAYQHALGVAPQAAENSLLGPLPQHFADRFGWQDMTAVVAQAYRSLPEAERNEALIVTDNYGEAGALRYYGRRYGLPPAVSQHNNFFFWGPGRDHASVAIVVGVATERLRQLFDRVEVVGRVESPYAMPFETRRPIHVCRGPKLPLAEAWRLGKHFI
jgi:4-amino-4-deoxy-L-arabinose transferase-like glycosyltransferase